MFAEPWLLWIWNYWAAQIKRIWFNFHLPRKWSICLTDFIRTEVSAKIKNEKKIISNRIDFIHKIKWPHKDSLHSRMSLFAFTYWTELKIFCLCVCVGIMFYINLWLFTWNNIIHCVLYTSAAFTDLIPIEWSLCHLLYVRGVDQWYALCTNNYTSKMDLWIFYYILCLPQIYNLTEIPRMITGYKSHIISSVDLVRWVKGSSFLLNKDRGRKR